MTINLNRWPNTAQDREFRNKTNDNWDKIERTYNAVEYGSKQAQEDSKLAKEKSIEANNISKSVQDQLNEVTISGDSSVEAAQARIDADNIKHPTLKARADSDAVKVKTLKENVDIQTKQMTAPYKYDGAVFTLVDDDGQLLFLSKMKPIYEANDVKATIGVITDFIGTSNYMNLEQLKTLQDEGYDIVCHSKTHSPDMFKTNINIVPDEAIERELGDSQLYMKENGLKGYETLIFPWGNFGTEANRFKAVARKFFKYAMNSFGGYNNTPVDNMYMNRYALDMSQDFTTVLKPKIDECIRNRGWMVFYTHSQENKVDTSYMNKVISYIKSQNAPILTFSEAINYKGNAMSVGEYTNSIETLMVSNDGKTKGLYAYCEAYNSQTDMLRPVSNFKIGVTTTPITSSKDTVTKMGGILTTCVPSDNTGDNPALDFCYQTYTPYNKNEIYMRKWIRLNEDWGAWQTISPFASVQPYDSGRPMDVPATSFGIGTTLTPIGGGKDTLTGLGGDLVTYIPQTAEGKIAPDFCYQTYTPYSQNKLYMRKWISASSQWGTWGLINGDTVRTSSEKNMDDPISSYPIDSRMMYTIWSEKDVFLRVGGMMEVIRSSNDDFSYATYTPHNTNVLYMRKWIRSSNSWGPWTKIGPQPTS
ncbi:hypothetical protein IEO_03046 [Bacillus wiedmannii]|uniref:polysaccharide deacetylase family protein n=1 Tax=Bacillus wiedmannii TaxID=1890302 RepID=UPI00027C007E|nr:polysaccharide deacetylase family protein [Bacillus wiedmannii]EJV61751.1 hypothetical protein IEO_03046 [Bacillus wiedmannii]